LNGDSWAVLLLYILLIFQTGRAAPEESVFVTFEGRIIREDDGQGRRRGELETLKDSSGLGRAKNEDMDDKVGEYR